MQQSYTRYVDSALEIDDHYTYDKGNVILDCSDNGIATMPDWGSFNSYLSEDEKLLYFTYPHRQLVFLVERFDKSVLICKDTLAAVIMDNGKYLLDLRTFHFEKYK